MHLHYESALEIHHVDHVVISVESQVRPHSVICAYLGHLAGRSIGCVRNICGGNLVQVSTHVIGCIDYISSFVGAVDEEIHIEIT